MTVNSSPLVEVDDLVLRYGGRRRASQAAPAVDHVSFRIERGEALGLVGESGSGKTTIGKVLLGLEKATSGTIRYDGADITNAPTRQRRELSSHLRAVFQDPYSSLNPRLTIGASLTEALRLRGVAKKEAWQQAGEALERVGLAADAVDRYPRQFSGGQRQRIAIARALMLDPDLVVCDEAVSALDTSTQAQVLNLLADIRRERGLSYLFIAHDISVVRFLAQRIIVLYRGQIMESGPSAAVTDTPRHPFTQALTAAAPVPHPGEQAARRQRREASGVKSAGVVEAKAGGCPFQARCPLATEICRVERPAPRPLGASVVACHHAE